MSEAPPDPAEAAWERSRRNLLLLAPLTNMLILLGSLLLAWGVLNGLLALAANGAAILLGGGALFLYEGVLSHRGVGRVPPVPPSSTSGALPWWKRPISYHGRWLCTSCGWREETRTTFCPRCGKVLVRLPGSPTENA